MDTIQCNYCRMNVAAYADNRCRVVHRIPTKSLSSSFEQRISQSSFPITTRSSRIVHLRKSTQLRSLVSSRVSQKRSTCSFYKSAFREADIPHLYRLHNLRRKQIQYAHRSKRTVRIAGGLIMFLALGYQSSRLEQVRGLVPSY